MGAPARLLLQGVGAVWLCSAGQVLCVCGGGSQGGGFWERKAEELQYSAHPMYSTALIQCTVQRSSNVQYSDQFVLLNTQLYWCLHVRVLIHGHTPYIQKHTSY